jgi:hypothetical protein
VEKGGRAQRSSKRTVRRDTEKLRLHTGVLSETGDDGGSEERKGVCEAEAENSRSVVDLTVGAK